MSLIKNLKNSDLKKGWRGIRNAVLQIGPTEQLVRDCTNNEQWPAKMSDKQEVARKTFNFEDYPIIMSTLWRRMQQEPANYRKIQKSLILLEFLLLNGSDRVIQETKANIFSIKSLRNFHYTDDSGKECGATIREFSRKIINLMKDEAGLKEERKKQKKLNSSFQGLSGDDVHGGFGYSSGGGGFGGSSSGFGSGSGFGGGYGNNSDDDSPVSKRYDTSDYSKKKYDSDEEYKRRDSDDEEKTVTRPRRDSNVKVVPKKEPQKNPSSPPVQTQTPTKQPQTIQGSSMKQVNILDMDDLFTDTTASVLNQSTSSNNPFPNQDKDQWETNFESSSNPFDEPQLNGQPAKPAGEFADAFDDDFGGGDFVSAKEDDKNTLFNISKGLVDLSLGSKAKTTETTQPQRKTLNQVRNEKAGMLAPNTQGVNVSASQPRMAPMGGMQMGGQMGGMPMGGMPMGGMHMGGMPMGGQMGMPMGGQMGGMPMGQRPMGGMPMGGQMGMPMGGQMGMPMGGQMGMPMGGQMGMPMGGQMGGMPMGQRPMGGMPMGNQMGGNFQNQYRR